MKLIISIDVKCYSKTFKLVLLQALKLTRLSYLFFFLDQISPNRYDIFYLGEVIDVCISFSTRKLQFQVYNIIIL